MWSSVSIKPLKYKHPPKKKKTENGYIIMPYIYTKNKNMAKISLEIKIKYVLHVSNKSIQIYMQIFINMNL